MSCLDCPCCPKSQILCTNSLSARGGEFGKYFKSSSLAVADFPPGLKNWFDNMKATKGVSAALAKGTDLMMGGRPFP